MFRGFSGDDYPDRRALLDVLLGAADRLTTDATVNLTADEATHLQQAGFVAVLGAGWYQIPRLPLDLLRPHRTLAGLATFWYGPHPLDPPPQPVRPQPAPVEMTVPGANSGLRVV